MRHRLFYGVVLLVLATFLASAATVSAARPPKPPKPSADISIFNFGYEPSSFIVGATGKVTWKDDEGQHTVTFTSLPIDSGKLAKGQTFTADFSDVASGTYSYYCTIHGFAKMNGSVTK